MSVVTSDVAAAEQAWADLRSALVNFENALVRVVETRAWEPLGYVNFAEAWADRMSGVRLATAVSKAVVVYSLIDAGQTRETALSTLGPSSGVGPATFDALARQKDAGVPPEFATTVTRRPDPLPPTVPPAAPPLSVVASHYRTTERAEPHTVRVELTSSEYTHFKAVAERHGMDLADVATRAVKAEFARLERRGGE
ncbi:MAG TPA: hypothetical protein VIO38_08905 [Rariglobus sp.]